MTEAIAVYLLIGVMIATINHVLSSVRDEGPDTKMLAVVQGLTTTFLWLPLLTWRFFKSTRP